MLKDKKLDWLLALTVFIAAFVIYFSTMAPTVSFWDCGELIAASNILGNPHPAGNPFFTLLLRLFIIVMPFAEIAARANFVSSLTMAMAASVSALFVVKALRLLFPKGGLNKFALYAGGLIGGFLVAFSDTIWFSAVEAEAYGAAMLIMMIVSWLSLHWYEHRGTPTADRSILLMVYAGFLGTGVHLFALVTLPVVALFMMFERGIKAGALLLLTAAAFFVTVSKGGSGLYDLVFGGSLGDEGTKAMAAALIISVVAGIATAVPLLFSENVRKQFPFLMAGVALFSIVYDVGNFLFYMALLVVVSVLALLFTKLPEWRRRWSIAALLGLIAVLGFSSYAYVPIRTSVNVSLDEAEATTWPVFREYLERKQYGSESMITRAFHRRAQLANQILVHPHMGFGGYLLAQYFPWKVGDNDAESSDHLTRAVGGKTLEFKSLRDGWTANRGAQFILFVLLQFPFLYGLWLVFRRNRMIGLYLFGLYAATTYGLIFYLNFADGTQMELRDMQYWQSQGAPMDQKPPPVHMEVRERDYFFTPGFIYMGILFGVAAAFMLNWMAARRRKLMLATGTVLAVLAFAVPVFSNYKEHNRSGDYVPYDYAYNLLNSCRPNSILFTNGDNDTFPLWFLQEVEGIRRDVRVVNLSLVNTNWYMHQLTEHEPALKIGFTSAQIDKLAPQAWPGNGPVEISIPGTRIRYQLDPLPYLRVQDIMILNIVRNNYPAHPVHFAVTIGGDNAMGLDQFTVMEGLVYTLVEDRRNREIDVPLTAHLVDSVYRFRGLGDPKVYIDDNTAGLLTNYSATNFRLAGWAQDSVQKILPRIAAAPAGSTERAALEAERDAMVAFAEKYLRLNERILPGEWRVHYYAGQLYQQAGMTARSDSAYIKGMAIPGPNARIFAVGLSQSYVRQGRVEDAKKVLVAMIARDPGDIELAMTLADLSQQTGDMIGAKDAMANWLKHNPKHQYAAEVGNRVRQMEEIIRNQPAPAQAPGVPAPAQPAPAAK
jgi:Flp pilus assembly protein TadD